MGIALNRPSMEAKVRYDTASLSRSLLLPLFIIFIASCSSGVVHSSMDDSGIGDADGANEQADDAVPVDADGGNISGDDGSVTDDLDGSTAGDEFHGDADGGGRADADGASATDMDGGTVDESGDQQHMDCVPGEVQTAACTVGTSYGVQTRDCSQDGSWNPWGECELDSDAPPITQNLRYVSISGPNRANDASHGLDAAPWATLSYAVAQLNPGDTLMVRQGYYGGTITLGNSGTSQDPIVIRSEVPYGAKIYGGLVVNADHVIIYGFDIEQPDSGVGITINDTQGVEILGNIIHDCPDGGIRLGDAAQHYRIANNVISYVGQMGIGVRGSYGLIDHNRILEVVAYHPKLVTIDVSNGDDADGLVLRGSNHTISNNLIANFADPLDVHNYYPPDPIHNAHCDCFDTRELTDTVIDGNYCWSNFHVSKGVIFNGSSSARTNITIRNNIFEYRDIGISAYEYENISGLFIYGNLLKSRIDDVIESWLHPGSMANIPNSGMHLGDVTNYLVFNNITVDCDNNNNPDLTGNPISIDGGNGTADYNFFWNSDGAAFSGADPGEHGSMELDPGFESYDTSVHGHNDYRLQASSPLIGLGICEMDDANGNTVEATHDMNGQSRPQDSNCEPGPFEYVPAGSGPASASISEQVQNPILELTPDSCQEPVSDVHVEIAKWPGNRSGAVVVRFDDSTPGHVLCGFDAFHSRNLTGTWYVNPGGENFMAYEDRWAQAPQMGQELANHTMHHTYETEYSMWLQEVEDAADAIWLIRHGPPLQKNASLMGFCNSDSVAWDWTPGEEISILNGSSNVERQSYLGPAYPSRIAFSVPPGSSADAMYCASPSLTRNAAGQCVDSGGSPVNSGVPRAMADGIIYKAAFHGILSTDSDACEEYSSGATDGGNAGVQFSELETFLDYLVAVRDQVWIAGYIQVYKYSQEYQRADIRMEQECSDRIYFDLYCPLGPLYDQALTLLVTVPSDWSSCSAMQGTEAKDCTIAPDGTVRIDAIPNRGRILLLKTG